MSAGKRRRRGGAHEEEHENAERWLVSYADMITVLMALFIVLFAISQVDQEKYIALRSSLAAGFSPTAEKMSVMDGTDGTMDGMTPQTDASVSQSTASMVNADSGLGDQAANPASAENDPVAEAKAELAHFAETQSTMMAALEEHGLADAVTFRVSERGLVVSMIASDLYFGPESAVLTPAANDVVDTLAPTFASLDERLSIEGHANVLPTSGVYTTNWELSADRAVKVLRRLVEVHHIPGERLDAVGYGDTRPLYTGDDPTSLAGNRRVDMVVVSDISEEARALLPALAGQ